MGPSSRYALAAAAVAVVLSIAGCGGGGDPTTSQGDATGTVPTVSNPAAVQAIPPAKKAQDAADAANDRVQEGQADLDAAGGTP